MFLTTLCLAGATLLAPAQDPAPSLLEAMERELQYSMEHLELPGGVRPYYLAYTTLEEFHCQAQAALGALVTSRTARARVAQVDARVGDYALDNTHQLRGAGGGGVGHAVAYGSLTQDDDEDAVRHVFWRLTDSAAKSAARRHELVLTNLKTKVEEEQEAWDFSRETPVVDAAETPEVADFRRQWEELVRRVSARARAWPDVLTSQVAIETSTVTRTLVTSEGTRLVTNQVLSRVTMSASTRAEDGMELSYASTMDARRAEDLPDEAAVTAEFDRVLATVLALRAAPLVEPFSGPAILRNRASGVFFHEIFGHRIEGHRQKDVEEGQTFAKKVGEAILPDFLSVTDDPTLADFGGEDLRGWYTHDDEGVPAQAVHLVEDGVLRTFLMSRTPLEDVPQSNGHGRRAPGNPTVARQGNLIVSSDKRVPFDELRAQLLEECRGQGKEYGLLFEDISGGFTTTQRAGMQAFKVLPLVVYRVYVDGRPDELVRGVDIVGTPLACFAEIVATGDDPAVFNGTCGAESGPVPVCAISPSILVRNIEIEKRQRGQEKLPLLASPLREEAPDGTGDPVFQALDAELARARTLHLDGIEPPYFVRYSLTDVSSVQWNASLGALISERPNRERTLGLQLRVGSPELDNSRFANIPASIEIGVPEDDDVLALRQSLWLVTDAWYKQVVEILTQKQAYMKAKALEDRPPDFSPVEAAVDVEEVPEVLGTDPQRQAMLKDLALRLSDTFREYPEFLDSEVAVLEGWGRRHLVTSEGTRLRHFGSELVLQVTALLVAEDGTRLADGFQVTVEDELPPFEELQARVRALADGLRAWKAAPILEEYTGPVLFEDRAAGQFFAEVLAPGLVGWTEQVGEQPGSPMAAISMERRLGKRILRTSLQVTDDPTLEKAQGELLRGNYRFDDEGVAAQPVELIKDGVLEDLLMSRAPVRARSTSNGHARQSASGGDPITAVGNLLVEDTAGVSLEDLRQELREEAGNQGLAHALRVVRLSSPGASQEHLRSLVRQLQSSGLALSDPLEVYRVSVADGTEERVRGVQFRSVTNRVLRDVLEMGDTPVLHHHSGISLQGYTPQASILAPPVLVEELELSRIQKENDQPPVLPTPLQRKAEAAKDD